MTKQELSHALAVAKTEQQIFEDIEVFDGYGLLDFKSVQTTVKAVAKLIRWQCFRLDGSVDTQELSDLATHARRKFIIIGT